MKRVLIVEDDPTWAMVLGGYASQLGLESVVAQSPQLAMDALDDGPIDLIILDVLLAVETGMTLLNELRGHNDLADIPVMVFSGLSGIDQATFGNYGVKACLDKSTATPDDIKYQIKELVNG